MARPSFSRSNVNERTLYISKPNTSSFNLSHRARITPQMGRLHPVNCEYVIPSDIVSGGLTPEIQLEKLITPEIGRTRLDTHTFLVPYRRIINNFKQFVERRNTAIDGAGEPELPTFNYPDTAFRILSHLVMSRFNQGEYIHSSLYESARLSLTRNIRQISYSNSHLGLLYNVLLFNWNTSVDATINLSLQHYFYCVRLAFLADVYQTYWMYLHQWYDLSQYCYPSDFYAEQLSRIGERLQHLIDVANLQTTDPDAYSEYLKNFDFHDMIEAVIFVLQPYMGIGSNMDYLGYPIYREYSDWYNSFFTKEYTENPISLSRFSGSSSDPEGLGLHLHYNTGEDSYMTLIIPFDDSAAQYVLPTICSIYELYYSLLFASFSLSSATLTIRRLNPDTDYGTVDFNPVTTHSYLSFARSGYMPLWTSSYPSGVLNPSYMAKEIDVFRLKQSEIPLRAAYAAWFDRFRDWHIEPRANTLDPDDWTLNSLITDFVGSLFDPSGFFASLGMLSALLVPRYRYYSKDALLTIQTEDVYRHVYAPIFTDESREVEYSNPNGGSNEEDVYNRILETVIDEVSISFPTGSLHRITSNSDSMQAFRNDLQTMRRTGMLESWLARNYFYPDNYNGQIEAHYGVQVSDLSLLYCTYLGGDESMISGDQVKAPVSTSEAPAGTRTFVGGAGHSDKFTFSFNDFGVVISFISVVPLVEYDVYNSHLLDNTYTSLPFPEYASDARITVSSADMLRGFAANTEMVGYVPRYYHYRVRLDEVHGRYLTDLRSYSWFRDWYNMVFIPVVGASATNLHGFSLHPYCLRVHLPLDSFLGLAPWDSIAFGDVQCDYYVTHPLPAAVEYF